MNTFWQSLHRIAQGQLFAHGYLSPRTAMRLANKGETPNARDRGDAAPARRKVVRWPRLAIPH
jgi:hypothetical protein